MIDPRQFIRESNKIEGILRAPTKKEVHEFHRFMALDTVKIADLETFVSVYQPDARLRFLDGMNVCVGSYVPPRGGQHIIYKLEDILSRVERNSLSAYETHNRYESLHPFTDGNGRSGRMLWLWQMREAPLGFLHSFYYQALSYEQKRMFGE